MGDRDLSCPELDALERVPLAAEVRAHVAGCPACELVLAVVSARGGASSGARACLPFDALLAARADGTINGAGRNLLDRHLASCEACRLVAETLSPAADTAGDHAALPSVDPGAYALGLEVARGGMGRILAARDLRIGRPVAVKELIGTSPQLAARFEREARVTARLQHPGIVPIYEIGTWPDGTPFYSMRMVDGRTLREAIGGAPTLAARLALLPAVIAACEAIAFAHAQRVIHRDLTPSNILVGAYGETVVIDWGLAKDLSIAAPEDDAVRAPYRDVVADDPALTQAGAVIGTVAYMPPEQARAHQVDERADVYALGAILYHLLAGAPPYDAPTAALLLEQVKRAPPAAIEQRVPGAPGDLVSIITKAMAREPDARYPSAGELTAELLRFQAGLPVRAHAYSATERVWRFVRRHRAAVVTTLLAAVLVAVVAVIAVARILRSRGDARRTAQALLLEKGRVELLDGNTFGALAYLHAASSPGPRSEALAFLTGAAMRAALPSSLLDCGGYAYAVELSPDGAFLAAACTRQGMIWRLHDRVKLATLGPFEGGFSGLRYAPDGATLASWGPRGAARLWDARTGTLRGTFEHGAEITTASFSPDGARLVTTGFDGHARIWDVTTGTQLRAISAADGMLRTVYGRMSTDGRAVYTSTLAGEGRAWDVATGSLLGGYAHGSFTLGGDVSSDGRLALSCGVDRLAKVWDASTGALRLTLAGHSDVIWRCVFDPQVTHVLTTGHDGRANVWDLATGALVVGVEPGDILTSAEFSPDGRRFATIGVDGRAKVWDARSGALLASVDARRGKHARFTPDSRGLIVQRGDGRIEVWDDVTSQLVAFTPASTVVIEVSSDARRTITEDAAGWIAVWDTARATKIETAALHGPVAVAAGAPVLAAIADDGVAIVSLETGATTRIVPVDGPRALALSTDGTRLGVVRADGAAEVWDTHVGRRLARLGRATELALSADGRRALVRVGRGAYVVWDVAKTARLVVLAVTSDTRVLGLSSDGRRAVLLETSGAPGQAASLWNTDTGQLMHREAVAIARLDPGGRRLTSIGADRRVRVRRLDDGREESGFEASQLVDAQVDTRGALVAALGEYGKAALVLDAGDGRVLARWPVEHAPPTVTQTGFVPPGGEARWSADGTAVVARSRGVTVWRVGSSSHRALAAAMNRVPWRVEDGQMVALRDRAVRARIVRAGVPVAGATVSLEIRRAPELGPGEINWDSIRTRYTTRATRSDRSGRIRVDNLAPGTYHLVVTTSDGETRSFEAFAPADRADVSEQTFDLATQP